MDFFFIVVNTVWLIWLAHTRLSMYRYRKRSHNENDHRPGVYSPYDNYEIFASPSWVQFRLCTRKHYWLKKHRKWQTFLEIVLPLFLLLPTLWGYKATGHVKSVAPSRSYIEGNVYDLDTEFFGSTTQGRQNLFPP